MHILEGQVINLTKIIIKTFLLILWAFIACFCQEKNELDKKEKSIYSIQDTNKCRWSFEKHSDSIKCDDLTIYIREKLVQVNMEALWSGKIKFIGGSYCPGAPDTIALVFKWKNGKVINYYFSDLCPRPKLFQGLEPKGCQWVVWYDSTEISDNYFILKSSSGIKYRFDLKSGLILKKSIIDSSWYFRKGLDTISIDKAHDCFNTYITSVKKQLILYMLFEEIGSIKNGRTEVIAIPKKKYSDSTGALRNEFIEEMPSLKPYAKGFKYSFDARNCCEPKIEIGIPKEILDKYREH
jgi:hypothetical protein